MWIYQQSTGKLSHSGIGRHLVGTGYSGHGAGVNNPALQSEHCIGPLPVGTYDIGAPITHPRLGPVSMHLSQTSGEDFGRDGFWIHGDNGLGNQSASEGCIVMARDVREQVADSGDMDLAVVE